MEVHTSPWWRKILPCLAALALALLGVTAASPASAASTPQVSVSVTAASVADGLGLKVSGSGFSDLPKASTGAPAAGVYVALRDPATMSNGQINADQSIVPAVAYVPSALINGGAWSASLQAPVGKLSADANYEVIVWSAHGEITDSTFLGSAKVTLTDAQKAALFPEPTGTPSPSSSAPSETSTPAPSSTTAPEPTSTSTPTSTTASSATSTASADPTSTPAATGSATGSTEPSVTCTVQTVPGSVGTPQLSWGVKSSFVSYIQGGIANGAVTTSGGASRSGNGFLWGAGSGSLDSSSGQGTVSFPGSVHFTGHDGALDITISGLQVKMTSARTGVLLANVSSLGLDGNRVGGQGLAFANLQFSGPAASGGTASVALTSAGANAFAGFYTAGEAMDSLTLSFTGARSASTKQVCQNADGETVPGSGSGSAAGASVNTGGYTPSGAGGSGHAADFGLVGAGSAVLALLMVALRRRQLARR